MKKILVIGGTGFIGKSLSIRLAQAGYIVTLLVRPKSRSKINGTALSPIMLNQIEGDLLDKESLKRCLSDFDAVINLASVIRTFNKNKYYDNVQGLKNLVEAMEKSSIKKLIYFSTQKVNAKDKGYYAKSKYVAETVLADSSLKYLIIRPNHVYDIDQKNDFYRMAKLMYYFHIVPVIGTGENKIQPILRRELTELSFKHIHQFLEKQKERSKTIEISGKETLSINDITSIIGKELGIRYLKIKLSPKILSLFKKVIPFDIIGFTEDVVSSVADVPEKNNFKYDLHQIVQLLFK